MSDTRKQPLTEEQKQIRKELRRLATPVKAYKSFFGDPPKQESQGDTHDLAYSLNMAQSHISIIFHEADYWKQRALSAEAELAKHGLVKDQKICQLVKRENGADPHDHSPCAAT